MVAAPISIAVASSVFFLRELNIMLLGEEQARTLGVDTSRLKLNPANARVAGDGSCGGCERADWFRGLMIPHLLRMLVGPDHRVLVPASLLGGAVFLGRDGHGGAMSGAGGTSLGDCHRCPRRTLLFVAADQTPKQSSAPVSESPAITLSDVRVRLSGTEILRGISADLPRRMLVWALVGPNGAGKSTLLRAASGQVPLSGGSVEIDGESDPPPLPAQDRPIRLPVTTKCKPHVSVFGAGNCRHGTESALGTLSTIRRQR